jgi:hypothetical protein
MRLMLGVAAIAALPACFITLPGEQAPALPAAAVPRDAADVVVNGVLLSAGQVAAFEHRYGMRLPAGAYWYDPESGAWGVQGGPTAGRARAHVNVGAALRADASGGGDGKLTGIFINGREIHPQEAALLSQYVSLVPGRYWIDAAGNAGYQGLPAMVNLVDEARARGSEDPFPAAAAGYPAADGGAPYFFEPGGGRDLPPAADPPPIDDPPAADPPPIDDPPAAP